MFFDHHLRERMLFKDRHDAMRACAGSSIVAFGISPNSLRPTVTKCVFMVGFTLVNLCNAVSGLALESGLHGRVLGHDEKGEFVGVVAGAKITFESNSGKQLKEAVSDTNGYYKIELPTGEFRYKIVADGYRTEQSGRGLRLAQGEGFSVANLSLTKGLDDPGKLINPPRKSTGKLSGRVVERTALGFVGIPNARIAMRREGSDSLIFFETSSNRLSTQEHGRFEIELETGKYAVAVIADGFETLRSDQPIEIATDQETKRDFTLIRKASVSSSEEGIRGTVSVVDSDREHPPIHLTLHSLTEGEPTTFEIPVAKNGGFSQLLEPGCYRVTASAEGLPTVSSPPTFVLPGRFSVVNLTLRSRAVPESKTTLEVFVFEKGDRGTSEVPLSNVRVSVTRANASEQTAIEGKTDATGHARLPLSQGGTYTATAFLSGYKSGSGSGNIDVGQVHEVGIELVKDRSAEAVDYSIQVSAFDAVTKMPLVGVRLLARQTSETLAESVRATTDLHGTAILNVKKSGRYSILAQSAGYLPKGDAIEVSLKGPNNLTILLDPVLPGQVEQPPLTSPPAANMFRVRGYVAYREVTGQLRSVPGAKITWQRTLPTTPAFSAVSLTGTDGKYNVQLQEGTYQVQVKPPQGFQALLEEVQVNSNIEEKYFVVDRADQVTPPRDLLLSLKGQVVTEVYPGSFTPVTSADVQVFQASAVERTTTNSRGEFGFRLPNGVFRLHIQARGYESSDLTVNLNMKTEPLRVELKRVNALPVDSNLTLTVVQRGAAAGSMTTVVGAKVRMTQGGKEVASGITNRNGQFSTRVKPGNYEVNVTKLGYSSSAKNINVVQANVIEQILLSPESVPSGSTQRATLTVQVNQRAIRPSTNIRTLGVPLASAEVVVMQGAQRVASGVTNAAGSYSVPLLPGQYSVKVTAQGFAPAGKTAQLTGMNAQVDFLLNRIGSEPINNALPGLTIDPNRTLETLDRGKLPGLLRDPIRGTSTSIGYVVEYRLDGQSQWIVIATKPTQQEASAALLWAIDRGRIPRKAQTRIRVESAIAR
ncbi:MAG: carboxypeptidase-like regulatory domain-containing protein [Pirellulaceae bacterium]|nr:carboxypeptidase-like regulatory domain-containing protein [Pirellulaceae bacterium]